MFLNSFLDVGLLTFLKYHITILIIMDSDLNSRLLHFSFPFLRAMTKHGEIARSLWICDNKIFWWHFFIQLDIRLLVVIFRITRVILRRYKLIFHYLLLFFSFSHLFVVLLVSSTSSSHLKLYLINLNYKSYIFKFCNIQLFKKTKFFKFKNIKIF